MSRVFTDDPGFPGVAPDECDPPYPAAAQEHDDWLDNSPAGRGLTPVDEPEDEL